MEVLTLPWYALTRIFSVVTITMVILRDLSNTNQKVIGDRPKLT